jgi:hypothetical protein
MKGVIIMSIFIKLDTVEELIKECKIYISYYGRENEAPSIGVEVVMDELKSLENFKKDIEAGIV